MFERFYQHQFVSRFILFFLTFECMFSFIYFRSVHKWCLLYVYADPVETKNVENAGNLKKVLKGMLLRAYNLTMNKISLNIVKY